ncbi:MAG: ATPase [Woeseiaceae bacterium]
MKKLLVAFLMGAVTPATAEVVSAGPGGFEVRHSVLVQSTRRDAWTAAVNVGNWWHPDHTISGDAGRMSIDAKPLGCFCESLGNDDGVVHLTVTSVSTNVMLRLTGGLGPLGVLGVNGNMSWEFNDEAEGTRVTFTYAVGGYREGGLDAFALPVDGVISEALERLRIFAEGGDPNRYAPQ